MEQMVIMKQLKIPMTGGNYYYISDFYYVGADSDMDIIWHS